MAAGASAWLLNYGSLVCGRILKTISDLCQDKPLAEVVQPAVPVITVDHFSPDHNNATPTATPTSPTTEAPLSPRRDVPDNVSIRSSANLDDLINTSIVVTKIEPFTFEILNIKDCDDIFESASLSYHPYVEKG